MKTFKKALLMSVCAVALVVASVMGTMAYLQAETGPITNTMTVGKVAITLDESKVNLDGTVVDGAAPVTQNDYKLVPGQTYTKDPEVHVTAGSENCYLFVEVVNEIAAIEKSGATTIAEQMAAKGWTKIGDTNVYYHNAVAKAGDDVPVFDSFTISNDVNDLQPYDGKTITVKAYAVQAEGFADAVAAWNATFGATA